MNRLHALVSVRCLSNKRVIEIITLVCGRSDVTRRPFTMQLLKLEKGVLGLSSHCR